jgi:prepilin-type N-terminal cleavage/methylation domain-containing protein
MRRGFTLVEMLVAVALSVVIVGIIASTAIQVQKSVNAATYREVVAQQARAVFGDIERDISGIIPCVQAAPPITTDARDATNPQRPLALESVTVVDGTGATRHYDVLRVYTTILGSTRAVVEFSCDGYPGGVQLVNPPGGGVQIARLRRHVLTQVVGGAVSTEPSPNSAPVLMDGVLAVQIDYLRLEGASAAFQPLDATTKSGAMFVPSGTLDVGVADPFTVHATDAGGKALLTALPLGGRLQLPITKTSTGANVLADLAVRARAVTEPSTDALGNPITLVDDVTMNDRIDDPTPGYPAAAFVGPAVVRVGILIAFGRGPDAETARFSQLFPVPRS